jgi:hypothetical protein
LANALVELWATCLVEKTVEIVIHLLQQIVGLIAPDAEYDFLCFYTLNEVAMMNQIEYTD